MRIEAFYRLLSHDKEGKLVKDSGMMPSHSFVLQFLEMIEGFLDGISKSAKDTLNASEVIVDHDGLFYRSCNVKALAEDGTFGIVVGTNDGSTAESNTNYVLDTQILHSSVGDADKMNYRAVTFVAPVVDGANVDFDISRPFINEQGDTITVKEIGIYTKNVGGKCHLILRDVVSDFAVTDGYTLTVVYTLRTTV